MQNNQIQQSNKENDYERRRQERLQEQQRVQRKRTLRKILKVFLATAVIGIGIGALIWYAASRPPIPEEEIISRAGLHWHPELSISIKGEKQEIPANIGIGITHEPLHTHDATGVIHMEMQGLVRKEDTTLGRFFKIWSKGFNSNCIFDKCNGSEGKVKMLVNGKENTEFDNYVMKDRDKIEIRYE